MAIRNTTSAARVQPGTVTTLPPPAPSQEKVAARAYEIWEQAGRPDGDGVQFWMEAEKELKTPR